MKTIKCGYRNRRLYLNILGVETEIRVGDKLMPGVGGVLRPMSVTGYQVLGVVAVLILVPLN